MHRYHKSYFQLILPFYVFRQLYEVKLQKSHISVSSVHKYHKSCSEFIWPFYYLLQLYEEKLQKSHISVSSVHKYHKSFSEFIWPFYDLLTTVWGKSSKIFLLWEFSQQVSQVVFWAHLTVLGLTPTFEVKLKKSHIFASSVHRYHKSYFQLFWPFYGFLQLYEVKLQKSHISVSSVHKYHKSCSEFIWSFYGFL